MAAERVDECAIGKNDMVGEFDSDIEEGVRAFFLFFMQRHFSKWPSQLSLTKGSLVFNQLELLYVLRNSSSERKSDLPFLAYFHFSAEQGGPV